jgi:hypothetical protein
VDLRLPSTPPDSQGRVGEEERAERFEVAAIDRGRVGGDEERGPRQLAETFARGG